MTTTLLLLFGKWTVDGNIICLGGSDNQVKIRGIRIECEEIENHLKTHEKISDAVVITSDNTLNKTLIAFLKISNYCTITTLQNELNSFLSQFVSESIYPSEYILVNDFPLSSSKKIDRAELKKQYLNSKKTITTTKKNLIF